MLVAVAEACLVRDPVGVAILVLRGQRSWSVSCHLDSLALASLLALLADPTQSPTKATGNRFPWESWDRRSKPQDVTAPMAFFQRGSQE